MLELTDKSIKKVIQALFLLDTNYGLSQFQTFYFLINKKFKKQHASWHVQSNFGLHMVCVSFWTDYRGETSKFLNYNSNHLLC